MIKYIGNFNDIEKEYIESQVKEDSIIIKQNPFSPLFSLEEVVQYVKNKINQNTLKVYYFNKHKLQQIITPAMFVCNLLNDTISVIAPIKNGPSEKLGILSGDKIVEIDGCEYILIGNTSITHKGNCKYCEERNKKKN